jgi:hypothetical protein
MNENKIWIHVVISNFLLTKSAQIEIITDMNGRRLSTTCPACGLPMQTAAMKCVVCDVKVESNFSQTAFDRLAPEDQEFLEQYLLAGFSIKTLEQNSPMGYAAIRSRLDRLIANYKTHVRMDAQKRAVLEQLRAEQITVAEAKRKLERLAGE